MTVGVVDDWAGSRFLEEAARRRGLFVFKIDGENEMSEDPGSNCEPGEPKTGRSEERFLDCAGRQLRRAKLKQEASACFARNDTFSAGGDIGRLGSECGAGSRIEKEDAPFENRKGCGTRPRVASTLHLALLMALLNFEACWFERGEKGTSRPRAQLRRSS